MWIGGPARSWVAVELAAGAGLAGLVPFVDRLGWVLLVPAAGFAAAFGLRDLLLTPVLEADAQGVTVRDGVRRIRAGWDGVERLRVVRDRRTPLLEIDLGGRIVVLSRHRLGARVEEVLEALEQQRPVR